MKQKKLIIIVASILGVVLMLSLIVAIIVMRNQNNSEVNLGITQELLENNESDFSKEDLEELERIFEVTGDTEIDALINEINSSIDSIDENSFPLDTSLENL